MRTIWVLALAVALPGFAGCTDDGGSVADGDASAGDTDTDTDSDTDSDADGDGDTDDLRSYHLGFTPFPYAATSAAVEYTYGVIAEDADLIAHHFDDGVPWPEALAGTAYPEGFQQEIEYRRANSPDGHAVYVAVTPIRLMRDGLALYRGDTGDEPLPAPWDAHPFDHPDVKAAFQNHCERMIELFEPDYFAVGIEVNLLKHNAPDQWTAYLDLHRHVYEALKESHPDLPVMVSLTGMDLLEGYTDADHAAQLDALEGILPYTDYLGLSMHLFISALLGDPVPETVFEELFALSEKPLAVCETSYPAESFTAYGGAYALDSNPTKQDAYFEQLFRHCDAVGARFIVNFIVRDYDALWEDMGSPDDFSKLWRDTGVFDEDGAARPVRDRWLAALAVAHSGG